MANKWIKWKGGELPVPEGTLVDVKHRDGDEYKSVVAGEKGGRAEVWDHMCFGGEGHDGDIVAYRISATPKP